MFKGKIERKLSLSQRSKDRGSVGLRPNLGEKKNKIKEGWT